MRNVQNFAVSIEFITLTVFEIHSTQNSGNYIKSLNFACIDRGYDSYAQ